MSIGRIAWLFGVLVLLNACGGKFYEDQLVPNDAVEVPQNAGYLVGSIGFYIGDTDHAGATSSYVWFRRIGSEESGSLAAKRGMFGDSGDYEEADRIGDVFALPLKPGAYEFHNVGFYFYGAAGSKSYYGKEEFSAPFTIEKDKVYYAGEFLAFGRYGRNIFRFVIPAGGYFVHAENFERDSKLIMAKYPELEDRPTETLDLNLNFPPLIVPAVD